VQPFTVMVLADTDPGPPVVDDELDTEPPPACTCTPVPPAELLLETVPALLPPADAPAALMLPSACFSTETVQLSPDEVLPFLMIVSAFDAAPSAAVSANAAVIVHARVMSNSSRVKQNERGRLLPSPARSILVLPHFSAFTSLVALAFLHLVSFAMLHSGRTCRGAGRANCRAALSAASR
jgi:hypothetical protein